MRKYILVISIIISIVTYSNSRVESYVDRERREDNLTYIGDEETPYTGEIIYRDRELPIERRDWYKEGVLEKVEIYYENGNVRRTSSEYIDGKLNGLLTTFYEDGTLMMETNYLDAQKHGIERGYNEQGILVGEVTYENGMINGLLRRYTDEGILFQEQSYKDDVLHGIEKLYDNEILIEEREYNEHGRLIREATYEDDMLNGVLKMYDDNGTLYIERTYVDDDLHGIEKIYENRRVSEEREYEHGKLIKTTKVN